MNEEIAAKWRKAYPEFHGSFKPKGTMSASEFVPFNGSPLPHHLVRLLPDDVAELLIKAGTKLKISPTDVPREENTLHLERNNYHNFFRRVGELLWDNHFTPEGRTAYAKLVGAENANKLMLLTPETSTGAHFATNFARLLVMQPARVLRTPKSVEEFLDFFRSKGLISPTHWGQLTDRPGTKPFTLQRRKSQVEEIAAEKLGYRTVATAVGQYQSYLEAGFGHNPTIRRRK
jgi:hypothetical protein